MLDKYERVEFSNFNNKELDKYWLFKKINFDVDIEQDLTSDAIYFIHPTHKYLEFLYKHTMKVESEQIWIKDTVIRYNELHNGLLSINRCPYFYFFDIKKLEKLDFDFICLEPNLIGERFNLIICDNLNELIYKEKFLNSLYSSQEELDDIVTISFDGNNHCTKPSNIFELELKKKIKSLRKSPYIYGLIHIRDKKIIIKDLEGRTLEESFENKIKTNSIEGIIYHKNNLDKEIDDGTIEYMHTGKRDGFIYLKPISIPFEHIKVYMKYTGNPKLHYFDLSINDWVEIKNGSKINIKGDLRIRIELHTGEKIFDLCLMLDINKIKAKKCIFKQLNMIESIDIYKSNQFKLLDNSIELIGSLEKNSNYETFGLFERYKYQNDINLSAKNNEIYNDFLSDRCYVELKEENELVCINFSEELNSSDRFMVTVVDDFYKDEYMKIFKCNKQFSDIKIPKSAKKILFMFYNKKLLIYQHGFRSVPELMMTIDTAIKGENTIMLNFRDGIMYFNDMRIRIDNLCEMYGKNFLFGYDSIQNSSISASLVGGKSEGYIYLNPIPLVKPSKLTVSIGSYGNNDLQYFDSELNEWVDINNYSIDCKEMQLLIRVKMYGGSRIYNSLVFADNDITE